MAKSKTTKKTTKSTEPLPEQENLPPKWECKIQKSDVFKDEWGGNHKRVEEVLEEISILARAGKTYKQISSHFNISTSTLNDWSKRNPDLKNALTESRAVADERVEISLYESCFDRTVKEVTVESDSDGNIVRTITKTRVIPANPTAIQYWLCNRANDRWKARQQLELSATSDGGAIPIRLVYDLDDGVEESENEEVKNTP